MRRFILVGHHRSVIDAKNRLSIPNQFRRQLDPQTTGLSFYILPGQRTGTLELYPEKIYERKYGDFDAFVNLSDEAQNYWTYRNAKTVQLESDEQGRVLLPAWLLKEEGFESKEVVLIGNLDRLELWRKDDFESFEEGQRPLFREQGKKAELEFQARSGGTSGLKSDNRA